MLFSTSALESIDTEALEPLFSNRFDTTALVESMTCSAPAVRSDSGWSSQYGEHRHSATGVVPISGSS